MSIDNNIDNRPTAAEMGVAAPAPVRGGLGRRRLLAGFSGSAALVLLAGCESLTPSQKTAIARLEQAPQSANPAVKPAAATVEPAAPAPASKPAESPKPAVATVEPAKPGADALAAARAEGRKEGEATAAAKLATPNAPAKPAAATTPLAIATAVPGSRVDLTPIAATAIATLIAPAGRPDPAKAGYFNVNGENFRVHRVEGALGQIYDAIVTDKSPREYGLAENPTRIPMPATLQEYNDRPRWHIQEYFDPANRNKFGILIPSDTCWKAPDWCGQSWNVSMAVGSMTDNMEGTMIYTDPGQWTMRKINQGNPRATWEAAFLLNGKYSDDGRWGSFRGEPRKVIPGADVFLRLKGLVPFRSVLFGTDPVTGKYLDTPGHVASEGSEMGIVYPFPAQNAEVFSAIGFALTYQMKPDEKDSEHEYGASIGPTAARAAGTRHNLLFLRDKGQPVTLR